MSDHSTTSSAAAGRSKIKKLRRLLPWGRIIIGFGTILLQFLLILFLSRTLSARWPLVYAGFVAISFICSILVWNNEMNSTYKISWIILFFISPLFGGVLYLVSGMAKVSRLGLLRYSRLTDRIKRQLFADHSFDTTQIQDDSARLQAGYLQAAAGYPVYSATATTYYDSGESQFEAMFEDLWQAKSFIFIEFFILSDGQLWRALYHLLLEKVKEGVEVRLMYDDIGSIWQTPDSLLKKLKAAGVKVHVFNPLTALPSFLFNNRDHRKLVIIDGRIAYTGGTNLADEYVNLIERFGHWKDAGLRLEGPACRSCTIMFLTLWNHVEKSDHTAKEAYLPFCRPTLAPGQTATQDLVCPYDDIPDDGRKIAADVYRNLINRATESIYVMTPYLVLDHEMLHAFYTAAVSGVKITFITPHIPDKMYVHAVTRSYYRELIAHGIEVYEYLPGFIHSKVMLVDDRFAVVGTVNFDYRSFYLHLENAVWMYKTGCLESIKNDFTDTIARSGQVTEENLPKLNVFKRIGLWLLRLFAPLM